jgi:hypothetical protein
MAVSPCSHWRTRMLRNNATLPEVILTSCCDFWEIELCYCGPWNNLQNKNI